MTERESTDPADDIVSSPVAVLEEFREAWRRCWEGGPRPLIATFLARVSVSDRPELLTALRSVEIEFLRRLQLGDAAPGPEPSIAVTRGWKPALPAALLGPTDAAAVEMTLVRGEDPSDQVGAPPGTSPAAAVDGQSDGSSADTLVVTPGETPPVAHQGQPAGLMGALRGLDDYELLGELGRGGMGVVYKAREKNVNRLVALKIMMGGEYASADSIRRFYVEAESAGSLEHPNIVPIYHVGQVNGMPYYTMRFVEGNGLDRESRDSWRTDPRGMVELLRKVTLAVQFAHSRGILHRDLKPANILVDRNGEPHITDFGLAKRLDQDGAETRSGLVLGTPDYMSPEQAAGLTKEVSVASDVYSLGSILFDLLIGQPPFRSQTVMLTLSRVANEQPRPPVSIDSSISLDLNTICLKCLEKDPGKRYASAQELADELQRFLRGEPILARPVGRVERARRWCRRNPVVAGLMGIVGALAVAWVVGLNAALVRISSERDGANAARDQARYSEAQAMQTLNDVVGVLQDGLRDRPDLQDLRLELLEIAFERLKKTGTARPAGTSVEDTRTLSLRTSAAAHQRMADIYVETGRLGLALDTYRRMQSIVEELHGIDSDSPVLNKYMAACSNKLGDVYVRLGQFRLAAGHYDSGKQFRQRWVELLQRDPKVDKWDIINAQWDTGVSCLLLTDLALRMGDINQAARHLKEADHWASFLPEDVELTSAKDYFEMATRRLRKGDVLWRQQDIEGAKSSYEQSIALLEDGLKKVTQDSVRLQGALADACLNLADLLAYRVKTSDAADGMYRRAFEICQGLHERDPRNVLVTAQLADAEYRWATFQAQVQQLADESTRQLYADCLTLCQELVQAAPEDRTFQAQLMMALARNGEVAAATESARQLASDFSPPVGAFRAACSYAVSSLESSHGDGATSQENSYADLAIQTLRQALAEGWNDRGVLAADPDLAALRDKPEFAQLLVVP